MIVDIRGGLGTSLLELMGCYALAIERGQTIAGIRINCGGESSDGVRNVLEDYISRIFIRPPAPVKVTDGTRKLGVLNDPDILPLVLKHRTMILRQFGPMYFRGAAPKLPVLHVRRGDYEWVPLETYIEYAKAHEVCLIGNVIEDMARVPGYDISGGRDPVKDWLSAFYAPEIIGTTSTFIVSILFMTPTKHVGMFKNQEGAVFTKIMGPLMRRFGPQFPNFRWIE